MTKSKEARLLISKSGGKRGGATMFRVSIPADWAHEMGLDEENREIEMHFDGETISIKKKQA